jgi:hypothetical protein
MTGCVREARELMVVFKLSFGRRASHSQDDTRSDAVLGLYHMTGGTWVMLCAPSECGGADSGGFLFGRGVVQNFSGQGPPVSSDEGVKGEEPEGRGEAEGGDKEEMPVEAEPVEAEPVPLPEAVTEDLD